MTSTAPDIQMLPPISIQPSSQYNPPIAPHSFKNFSSNDIPLNATSNTLTSPENASKRHQWEKDFSHNWNILKNPSLLIQMEALSLQSTEDLQSSQSQTPTEQTEEITPLISPKINTNNQLQKSNSQSKTGLQKENKKQSTKKEKKIIIKTIEDFKAKPTKETKINSPRSLAAMDITANNINELYQMTLKDFEEQFPETLKMTEEDKQKRYEKLESKRQEKIEEIITVRNEILQYEREEIEKYE